MSVCIYVHGAPKPNAKQMQQTKTQLFLLCRGLEPLRVHVNLAQTHNTPAELQQRLHALKDLHVREANLLDKLELGVLA